VRIQDTTITTDCFSYVDFSIIVNDVPQIELTPDTLEVCDDDFDGFGLFDLSLANEQILNGLDPLEFEVTYYETPENAEAATNPIATPFSYTNLNPTNHEVYVRVENIITGCYNAVPLPLLVNPLPTIVLPTPLAICDDLLADSFTAFDLTVKNTEITLGDGSLEVVYYTSLLDAESANNAILDPTSYTNQAIDGAAPNPQTLHVRVTDLDTGCYDLTTLTIRVLPNPTPSPDPVDLELCDETSSGDGLEVFDLTIDEVFILNGELGVSASYYQTLEDAEAGENAIATPQAYTNIETPAQLIYVRVTNDLTGCYTLVDFNIIVHPLPQANVVSDLIACELDTDDVFDFDLESQTDLILGGQDPSLFEVTYHTSLLDAETGLNFLGSPYTNISDPEVIFVSVVNTDTGCRNTQLQFNLEVHEAAQAFAPLEFYVLCDDNVETDGDPSNDSVEFDLSVQDAFVLDGQDPLNYTVSYYASQSDADQGINALPMLYQNTVNPQVIIARVDNDIEVLDDTGALVDSSICYATALLTLNVDPLPIVLIDMDYILCVDTNGTEVLSPLEIETGLSSEDYTFIWSDATGVVVGTGSSYAPSQGGTYSLEVFDATLQTQCAAPVEVFTVIESTPPILTAQVTTAAFASTHVIEALATGQGVYEYSLDQGPWGDSGVFVDVTPGEHVVTARDLNGCGETQVVVYVIDYPLYFTPNGDGYNDTWNIVGVANQNNAKILIFDRFGKLLKQISPSGEGWDGTYNGAQLPSSDYWFTLDYTDPTTGNPQVLRAHFALKR
jgi:gliding motility-associated-like protein